VYHCDEVRLGLLLGDTGIELNCNCATVGTNDGLLCATATGQAGAFSEKAKAERTDPHSTAMVL